MNIPFITCIIPIYNAEKYLRRTLESVLNQNFKDYELILINDGSTDDSDIICKEYQNKYPEKIVIYNIKNSGVAHARNVGINKAKGQYLYFIDSDDELYKNNVFEQYYNAVQSNKDLNLIIQGYTTRYINGKTGDSYDTSVTFQTEMYKISDKRKLINLFPNGFMYIVWNKLFKKEIIINNKIQFYEQQMEDFRFVLNFLQHIKSFLVLDYIGYRYYRISTEKTLVTQIRPHMFDDYSNIHKQLNTFFENKFENEINNIMFAQYYSSIIKYIMNRPPNYNKILQDALSNIQIQNSLKSQKPHTIYEALCYFLIKYRIYSLFRFLHKLAIR